MSASQHAFSIDQDSLKLLKLTATLKKLPTGLRSTNSVSNWAGSVMRYGLSEKPSERKKEVADAVKFIEVAKKIMETHGFVPTMSSLISYSTWHHDIETYQIPPVLHNISSVINNEENDPLFVDYQAMFDCSFEYAALWYIINRVVAKRKDTTLAIIRQYSSWYTYCDDYPPTETFESHSASIIAHLENSYTTANAKEYLMASALTFLDPEFVQVQYNLYTAMRNSDAAAFAAALA